MENVVDIENKIRLFSANSHLQDIIFQHSHNHLLCIFSRNDQVPVKICTIGGDAVPSLKFSSHRFTVLTPIVWSP